MPIFRESHQRKAVLNNLSNRQDHPVAADIYADLRPAIPNLSLGTVYRNLEILETQGKIISINVGQRETHYDAFIEPHAHFYCRQCERIYDFDLEENCCLVQKKLQTDGHRIEKTSIEFIGICKSCTFQ
ncbi:transcriptional repressor [bacterium]|nr:transcriptional repressor [bacterium]